MSTEDDDGLDSALDKNLSDIEDLPSFETPPKGTYIFLMSGGTKKVNGESYAVFDCEVTQTVKLNNDADVAPKEGDKTGVMFNLENEFGLGYLKKFLAPFAAHFQTDNVKDLVKNRIQNLLVSATVDHQKDKDDPSKVYTRLKNIVIQ